MTHEVMLRALADRANTLIPKARSVAAIATVSNAVPTSCTMSLIIGSGRHNRPYILRNRIEQFERLCEIGMVNIIGLQSSSDDQPLYLYEQTFNRTGVLEKVQELILEAMLDEIERLVKEIEDEFN